MTTKFSVGQIDTFSSPSYFNNLEPTKKVAYLEKRIQYLLNGSKIKYYDLELKNCALTDDIFNYLVDTLDTYKFFKANIFNSIQINDAAIKYLDSFKHDKKIMQDFVSYLVSNENCSYDILVKYLKYLDKTSHIVLAGKISSDNLSRLMCDGLIELNMGNVINNEIKGSYYNFEFHKLLKTEQALSIPLDIIKEELTNHKKIITKTVSKLCKALVILLLNNEVDEVFEIELMTSVKGSINIRLEAIFSLINNFMNVKRSEKWFTTLFSLVGNDCSNYLSDTLSTFKNSSIQRNEYIFDTKVIDLFKSNNGMHCYSNLTIDEVYEVGGHKLLEYILCDIVNAPQKTYKKGILFLAETTDCGDEGRTIYTNVLEPNKVHIGCFYGTLEKAIEAINKKYTGNKATAYIEKVKTHFEKVEARFNSLLGGYKGLSKLCKANFIDKDGITSVKVSIVEDTNAQLNVYVFDADSGIALSETPVDELFAGYDLDYYKISSVVLDTRILINSSNINSNLNKDTTDMLLIKVLTTYYPELKHIKFDFGRKQLGVEL